MAICQGGEGGVGTAGKGRSRTCNSWVLYLNFGDNTCKKMYVYFTALFLLLSSLFTTKEYDWRTPFEKDNNHTATYGEAMAYYQGLATKYKEIKIMDYGMTDAGYPLSLVIVSGDSNFNPRDILFKFRTFVLVNNAIHAGEPEGVDASMMLVRDLVQKPELKTLLKDVVFGVIPMYNIEGGLNRGCCSRVNQNGPDEYGFRGNGQNLDLNRDFIKCDSRNARAFTELFREWDPDIFLDNHTSDGADYQYTLTYITNHPNELTLELSSYLHKELVPFLNDSTTKDGFPLVPYVETIQEIPDSGLVGFVSPPRFSNGYTALYNTIGFTVETHMLKPFPERVKATYSFMQHILKIGARDRGKISRMRTEANKGIAAEEYVLDWKFDPTRFDMIPFKGYSAKYKLSDVSGRPRLYYDRNEPYEKQVRFYNYATEGVKIKVPDAYIVPQSWWRVIELLKLNGVKMRQLRPNREYLLGESRDTLVRGVKMYYIDGFDNVNRVPYEGHYLHTNVNVKTEQMNIRFQNGDYYIPTDQPAWKYIVHVLEPQAPDSYFAWNFFDAILQQKEYYSDYVFEDRAAELLNENPALRNQLQEKRLSDTAFTNSGSRQLDFVYKQSPYFEKTYMRYPVGRVFK
jgi:hypothetical protein